MRLVWVSVLVGIVGCGGAEANHPAKRGSVLASIASSGPQAAPKSPPREDPTLLSRQAIFGNPDRALPMISPDGKRMAWLSSVDGVLNVWVGSVSDVASAKPITHDKKRGIRSYRWAFTSDHILYAQDRDGDENWHVHVVDLKTGEDKDLTPIDGAQARLEAISHKAPNEVLIGINDRDKRYHDVWRIDFKSGKKTMARKNDGYVSFHADADLKVRFGLKPEKDGSNAIHAINDNAALAHGTIPLEDTLTTGFRGFDLGGKKVWMVDSRGRDTAALVELDVDDRKDAGRGKVLLDDGQADLDEVILHPTKRTLQAALASYDRLRWHIVDPAFRKDFDALEQNLAAQGVRGADIRINNRTLADDKWLVNATVSDGPQRYYLHERGPKEWKTTLLFSASKALEAAKLATMAPVVLKSRDGLDLVSYLTLPVGSDADGNGRPDKGALPMVLLVHGGPWGRDEYGLSRNHQWLASRGYAVLSVNYRGSTGFGKKFVNAADKEWAAKMHDDLIDAVTWAVQEKIASKDKVAIMGGSYGGYATLVGLTFTPDTFACGVDIVGPSNLVTLLQAIPPYWEVEMEQFTKRIGDHRTEDGKKLLTSRSPLSFVDKIKRPLLIGQGANDPRVKQAESDQIVKAMQAKGIPVTYVLYPDEGHGFARPENRTSFNAVAEIFLAQCLGGSYEPIGNDFKGSSITVPAGKDAVHAVGGALK